MNNQKDFLIDTWQLRANLFFIINGIKNVVKDKKALCLSSLYWLFIIIVRRIILLNADVANSFVSIRNSGRASLLVIFSIIIYIGYLLFKGKPKGAGKMMRDFIRIGLVNHVGETPLLIIRESDSNNPDIYILTFRNFGVSISKWNDCKEQIESGLNLNIENIEENGKKYIIVKAVSGDTPLPTFIEWNKTLLPYGDFILALGESYTGQVTVNLAKTPHILIGGSTGSGKSILLKLLLVQSVEKNAYVYIADFKGGVDFPKIWHNKCTFITEKENLIDTLNELIAELHRRKKTFVDSDCANIDEYNKKYNRHLRRIIFACDEVAELLDKTGLDKKSKDEISEIEAAIATIARLGRAFGIHLILATQRPDANIISGQIKNNIDFRVCGRADDVLSQIILDKTDASDVISKEAQGRFLTNTDTLFQGYWFDDSKWQEV